ncbi:retrovirus-related pol polyprotein from transposon TNT 1-94, partial [Tanacetum coccineum]
MLTKPQFFYDNTTKQALGFQNPFYLKKAQQLEPMLYVGDLIQKTNPIVILDSEETLTLAEESRSKMLLKHKDNMMQEKIKQIDTTPIDYAALNQLYKDFETRFVPQSRSKSKVRHMKKIQLEGLKLPKLKLTYEVHSTTICVDELAEVQNVFYQMEQVVEQHQVDTPLNKENFQMDNSISNQSAPSVDQLFELNELKAQSQEKDMVIKKLKERIKSLSGNMDKDKIKQDLEENETINIVLDDRVTKLIAENEHLKQTYKQCYDSIKPAGVRLKEQCADLTNQVNLKSVEIFDLIACLQEKVFVITTLKDELRKLKGKDFANNEVTQPSNIKTNAPVSKSKVLQSVSTNKKEPNKSWGSIISDVPSSSLNECRSSKLSSGVDLLTGSQGNNLYTLSLGDMMASSPICLLSKASKTKSWLWHRRLSHLNFGAINHLARHGLVRGLPKLKFEKDHLCSACAMGKSKKKPHKPKSKDTNQEKLYLLHMDLCGPMRVASVNGKKFLKMIQLRMKVPVRCIRTDNGTEFVNQTLCENYEKVGISHEASITRSPQQNGVVERRNHTLIEAARIMLICVKALLFLWAEAVATTCYTQNRSIICLRHGKTPYKLLHDKLPDLSFFYVFGALCYPTNDSENLGKLVSNPPLSTPFVPPSRTDWDMLFQPLFDELLNPSPSVDHPTPEVVAPIDEVTAPEPAVLTDLP